MKILLTGNKGFIGRYLEEELLKRGHKVIGFDKGDKLPKKADVVYHLAANSSVYPIIQNPQLGLENITLTFEVLEWMRKTKTKKIIFASSREVYSDTLYGASKNASEALIEAYSGTFGIKYAILRLANIYGANDHKDRFIPTVIRLAKQNKSIPIYGGKKKKLNFVYIDDCIRAFVKALKWEGVYDVNYPLSFTLYAVARYVVKLLRSKSKLILKPERRGETLSYLPRPSFIKPKVSLKEGLARC